MPNKSDNVLLFLLIEDSITDCQKSQFEENCDGHFSFSSGVIWTKQLINLLRNDSADWLLLNKWQTNYWISETL